MDKITRLLLLYSKLMRGEKINKVVFCMETDSLPRTFDRDIEDLRLYLSEMFCNEELLYSRQENIYYLAGSQRTALEDMEYLFIERLLLDTGALRADEMDGMLTHLASNTENIDRMVFRKKECVQNYIEPLHNKAIIKMHGDLTNIITNKSVIKINYIKIGKEVVERELIPCAIKFDLGYLYLIAFSVMSDKPYPAYFRLDRIYSFTIIRSQRNSEIHRVSEYLRKNIKGLSQMYGGKFTELILSCKKEYFPYIHDKFRNATIIENKDDILKIKLSAFEDGFVKWLMSQSLDFISVLEPQEVKQKIKNEAMKFITKYGGV